jgi:hypothetical protein
VCVCGAVSCDRKDVNLCVAQCVFSKYVKQRLAQCLLMVKT